MFEILKKTQLSEWIFWLDILAPRVASSAMPGQFVIVKDDEYGERIPLTICGYQRHSGVVSVVVQAIGSATKKLAGYNKGESFADFVGPLGNASHFTSQADAKIKTTRRLFVAGGLGAAPVLPQASWLSQQGGRCDVIIGARSKNLLILQDQMAKVCETLHICTDDGSCGFHGNVAMLIKDLVQNQGQKYDEVVVIGPMVMMKFAALATKEFGIKTIASMNPIMVDGTGMCGACCITVGNKVKFACVDGPEFDAHLVDFDEAMNRLALYKTADGRETLASETPQLAHASNCSLPHDDYAFNQWKRVPMPEQAASQRAHNFEEVGFGYSLQQAKQEAQRCLGCKNAKCTAACPVGIDIPQFIGQIKEANLDAALETISQASCLPAVCGRVCPQESQCEGACIRGIKGEAVAIGRLERFIGDYAIEKGSFAPLALPKTGKKVAVVGAGPAGLACAGDLAKMGHHVKIFEVLHQPGGVLVYGIPEFRLPKEKVVAKEIASIKKLGVEIETNVLVGRTVNIDKLMAEEGFDAVFIGSGAGLPKFMGIPGENANGVFSANEYLTRSNLMKAYSGKYSTPIKTGNRVVVVGGGNVAMDAARTALRLGASVQVVYRRSMQELPARLEEVHHAQEEGVLFNTLANPVEIIADENGWVKGLRCVKMQLGQADESGRRSPVEIPLSEFLVEADTVLMALGTMPNPLITATTKGIKTNSRNGIVVDAGTGQTSRQGIFAGGDAVTGAATVILAMGAGRKAAKGIDAYLIQEKASQDKGIC